MRVQICAQFYARSQGLARTRILHIHTKKFKKKSISKFTQLANKNKIEGQFTHMKNFKNRKGRCIDNAYIFNSHNGVTSCVNQ
jgi:hypothetical protein